MKWKRALRRPAIGPPESSNAAHAASLAAPGPGIPEDDTHRRAPRAKGASPQNGPFANAPATVTFPGQQAVTGFTGAGLVNSFNDGDWPVGTMKSPAFTVNQDYLNFLVGGGNHPGPAATSTTHHRRGTCSLTD